MSNKTEDLSRCTMEELYEMKEKAIKNLYFEEAQRIKDFIIQKKTSNFEGDLQDRCEYLDKEINVAIDECFSKLESTQKKSALRELETRQFYDLKFQELQTRHLNEAMELEKTYAVDVLKSKSRPVKAKLDLEKKAILLAKDDDFEGALHFRREAELAQEKAIVARREKLDAFYYNLRTQLQTKQRTELVSLNEKFLEQLRIDKEQNDEEVESAKKVLKIFVMSIQQKVITDLTHITADLEKRKTIGERISAFVMQKMSSYDKYDISKEWVSAMSVEAVSKANKTLRPGSRLSSPARSTSHLN